MAQQGYIAVDSETTGLDPLRTAIIELGATVLDKQLRPLDGESTVFHCLIQPPATAKIEPQAIKINGHEWVFNQGSETFKNALAPAAAWEAFVKYLRSQFGPDLKPAPIIVGWNPGFDEGFLRQLYRAYLRRLSVEFGVPFEELQARPLEGHKWPLHHHKIDGIGIARYLDIRNGTARGSYQLAKMRQELCPIGGLAEKYGASHTALADIFAMLDVLNVMEMQYRQNILDHVDDAPMPVV